MPPFVEAQVGNSVTLEGRFWNVSGALTDPTNVTLTVTNPAGTATVYALGTLTHAATGVYRKTIVPATAGVWTYSFDGDGTVDAASTGYVLVGGSAHSTVCSAWAAVNDLDACDTTAVSEAAEGVKEQALLAASDLLWRWSGYRYPGLCVDTVRPCAQNTSAGDGFSSSQDYAYGWGYSGWWSWLPAWGSCACQANVHRACGCMMLSEVRLGRAPIQGILSVKVDGVALVNGTDYRLDDNEWLVALGGRTWPCCQDLTLDDTHSNTWSVSFVWGKAPPASGVTACVDLAAQLIKDCIAGSCSIPERAQQIQRQGVTLSLISPERYGRDQFGNMRVGIRSVDLFLSAVGTSRPGLIVSSDLDADVRRANT